MYKIVITGEKGGTGKSTITALLIEYLNFLNKKVKLIDTDPLQISSTFINNCKEEGRILSVENADYQVVDTAGVLGASLLHINQANIVIVPFRAHYADLLVVIPWFSSLNKKLKEKVLFLPNYWRKTKEQKEGLNNLEKTIKEEEAGRIIKPLSDKPAQYGIIINGSKNNFFSNSRISSEAKEVMEIIVKSCEK